MPSDLPIVPGALTVAVSSGKGGVGKTTTAVALAARLADQGADVLLIDGDIYGPNVHLVAGLTSTQLSVRHDPLELTLPVSPFGFRVVTPVSVQNEGHNLRTSMFDLFAIAQFAAPAQVVVVDMPPGWTKQHTDVCTTLPDLVVAVVAPTEPAVADHDRHLSAWQQAWGSAVKARREADRRRKLVLPESPTVLTVETMARFTGVPDGGGDPVTIRRLDAVPTTRFNPLVSVPAAADIEATSSTEEIGSLAAVVLEAAPA